MKIVLATGIYPPEIGGPATYTYHLAGELSARGYTVSVVTYGERQSADLGEKWNIIRVPKHGGPFLRWWRYSRALQSVGHDADIVYAFSTVSCGLPMWLARLAKPKKVLRLGGDFLWERATALGSRLSLRQWHAQAGWQHRVTRWLLHRFNHVVFSTAFQQDIYREHFTDMPSHSVLENAVPDATVEPIKHTAHNPLRLIFLGRFVHFKNLDSLIAAMKDLPSCMLTLVGDGPAKPKLQRLVADYDLHGSVAFVEPVNENGRTRIFAGHDVLVIPSLTEISPNTALEASRMGLPVLLTEETGLSFSLSQGMILHALRTPEQIVAAVHSVQKMHYATLAEGALAPVDARSWSDVAAEHKELFHSLLQA